MKTIYLITLLAALTLNAVPDSETFLDCPICKSKASTFSAQTYDERSPRGVTVQRAVYSCKKDHLFTFKSDGAYTVKVLPYGFIECKKILPPVLHQHIVGDDTPLGPRMRCGKVGFYAIAANDKVVTCKECLAIMHFGCKSVPMEMRKPYWTQLPDIPWLYVNSDGTKIRIYTSTSKDYIEATITTHGTATPEKALKIVKPYIKSK